MRLLFQFGRLRHVTVIALASGLVACVPRPERWEANYLAENYSCIDLGILSKRLAREQAEAGGSTARGLQQSHDPFAQWNGRLLDSEIDARFRDREVPLRQAKVQKKC